MTTPHSPTPEAPREGVGPGLASIDPAEVQRNAQARQAGLEAQKLAEFAGNLQRIRVVPELVTNLLRTSGAVARALQESDAVGSAVPTDSAYQTHHDYEHIVHHSGHPRPGGKRSVKRLGLRQPVPSEQTQGTSNSLAYHRSIEAGGPQGWLVRLDDSLRNGDPKKPQADMAMLDTDGKIYDVNGVRRVGDPKKFGGYSDSAPHLALGEHKTGDNYWQYLPSSKVAAALLGTVPTHDNEDRVYETGNAIFGNLVGPDWASVADPLELISVLTPELQQTVFDRLRTNGSMDNVEGEIRHLATIGRGLAALALDSGKFQRQPEDVAAQALFNRLQEISPPGPEQAGFEQIKNILPEIDSLEFAIANRPENPSAEEDEEIKANLVRLDQLERLVQTLGGMRIPINDNETTLNPNFHHAVLLSHDSLPAGTPHTINTISKVFRSGFMMQDGTLVRPAMVEVKIEHEPGFEQENSDDDHLLPTAVKPKAKTQDNSDDDADGGANVPAKTPTPPPTQPPAGAVFF